MQLIQKQVSTNHDNTLIIKHMRPYSVSYRVSRMKPTEHHHQTIQLASHRFSLAAELTLATYLPQHLHLWLLSLERNTTGNHFLLQLL